MYLGPIPSELKDLTPIEELEAMIACCRAKCWIVQLKEENQSVVTVNDFLPPKLEYINSLNSHTLTLVAYKVVVGHADCGRPY